MPAKHHPTLLVPAWLAKLYGVLDAGDSNQAIDQIFDTFDRLGRQEDADAMAAIVRGIDVSRLNLACIVALAEIGNHHTIDQTAMRRFMDAARPRLHELDPMHLVRLSPPDKP